MFDYYDTLITPEEVADMLNCGMNTTYKLLKTGKIKAMRIGRVYIEKINQELNQQLQVLRAIDYDAYEKELAQINTISGLLDDKQTCTDKIYQKLNEMRVNMQFHSSEEFDEKMMDDEFVLEL